MAVMENILAQCGVLLGSGEAPLLLSVFAAGLLGSMSHCSVMCSPLVASQMLAIGDKGHSQWHMLYFHAGRLLTYALLGAAAAIATQMVFSGMLEKISHAILFLAGGTFMVSAILPRKTHHCCSKVGGGISRAIESLRIQQLVLFLKGMMMGFMPCGMVVAVLLVVAATGNLLLSVIMMTVFGVATIPMLQVAGFAALSLSRRYPFAMHSIGRGVMALNGFFLCGVGLNVVSI